MRHDSSIPVDLHTDASRSVVESLGSFWSSVFADRDLVYSAVTSRVLSLAQLHIDVMEALSLRDHANSPVFHREHWMPIVIRKSQQNKGRGLHIRMDDRTVIGKQSQAKNPGHVYLEDEVFKVGGNAVYSKVNTYPISTFSGCRLESVKTCLCDSISGPKNILVEGRDFSIRGGVLTVRKEKDPFQCTGYRTVPDGDDTLLVIWACDALVDTNNVGDFVGYPLGIDVATSERAARAVSALWDVVVHGVTPRHLNAVLGSLFDTPTAKEDETIESVSAEDGYGFVTVVTDKNVYRVEKSRILPSVKAGCFLSAGSFLTGDLTVYRGLSPAKVSELVEDGTIKNLAIPRGGVLGVDEIVVLEKRDSEMQDGGWFKLSESDSAYSPFWTAVFGRTTKDERESLFRKLADGGTASRPTVNPLKVLGCLALSNLILVATRKSMGDGPYVGAVFDFLCRLVPGFSRLMVIQFDWTDESVGVPDEEILVVPDDAEKTVGVLTNAEAVDAGDDEVVFSFVPDAATEV